jgi:hypothetical protein
MSETHNGGPAFPQPMIEYQGGYYSAEIPGMSLRDWFAAHASEADLAPYLFHPLERAYGCDRSTARFLHADAMLAARKAGGR